MNRSAGLRSVRAVDARSPRGAVRAVALLVALTALVGLEACRRPAGAPAPASDELVLELGGDGIPIAELLRRAEAMQRERPEIEVPPIPEPPAPPQRTRLEYLAEGETLSTFCQRVLGQSRRWQEVQELNGLSDDDLRRLAPGTPIRVPVD